MLMTMKLRVLKWNMTVNNPTGSLVAEAPTGANRSGLFQAFFIFMRFGQKIIGMFWTVLSWSPKYASALRTFLTRARVAQG